MNKKSLFVYCLFIALLISCNHVYKEYDKESFTTLSWKQGQEVSFYPEITDTTKNYQLILGIRHIYDVKIKHIDISIKIISPQGKEIEKNYIFQIRDAQDQPLASCAGNMCDLETAVGTVKFSEPGKYQFLVTNNSEGRIIGVMEFGLIIDETD
jgi:gliding motility-associated lipoprotein GldH